jgi:predicted Zn finger-like uncharacterized protein
MSDVSATPASRVVRCAECASAYVLPFELMGPRGARVRCRVCGARFDVLRDADAAAIAREVIEGLAWRVPFLIAAGERGRLLSEGGAVLLEAYDTWRARAGPAASAATFRDTLRALWNIDLPGFEPTSDAGS